MSSHRKPGDWASTQPEGAAVLFDGMTAPWWIAGGHAIDLFIGHKLRDHEDLDVGVPRRSQLAVREHLYDWDLHYSRYSSDPEDLTPWEHGKWVDNKDRSVWCRRTTDGPWEIEVMLLDVLGKDWIFRRAPKILLPLTRMGKHTDDGIPYLAPELALLFKAEVMRKRDEDDFDAALPLMDPSGRNWLARAIEATNPRHSWLKRL